MDVLFSSPWRPHVDRQLAALGHDVRLIPAKYVKPFLKGHKNDYRDAEAIAEAVHATATAACRFFDRRLSPITRAFGSPKMPAPSVPAENPGSNMRPKVADIVSPFSPSTSDAKSQGQP